MVAGTSTIGEAESVLCGEISDILHRIFPQTSGLTLQTDIYENGRKKRRDASWESWRPEVGEIRIKLSTVPPSPNLRNSAGDDLPDGPSAGPDQPLVEQITGARDRLNDLINALHHAEERPGFDFVALTWFRDLFLPDEAPSWANSAKARDEVLRAAIQDSVVLTSKVPNPKAPSFPVTAIRLSRRHPDVQAILGEAGSYDPGFRPVKIRGEKLSDTVLHDRR